MTSLRKRYGIVYFYPFSMSCIGTADLLNDLAVTYLQGFQTSLFKEENIVPFNPCEKLVFPWLFRITEQDAVIGVFHVSRCLHVSARVFQKRDNLFSRAVKRKREFS